jgi:hypothetical protein
VPLSHTITILMIKNLDHVTINKLVIFKAKPRNLSFLVISSYVLVSFSPNQIFEEYYNYILNDKLNNKQGVINNT